MGRGADAGAAARSPERPGGTALAAPALWRAGAAALVPWRAVAAAPLLRPGRAATTARSVKTTRSTATRPASQRERGPGRRRRPKIMNAMAPAPIAAYG